MESVQSIKKNEIDLEELVHLTQNFIKVADDLYKRERIGEKEYREITYLKKDFLQKIK